MSNFEPSTDFVNPIHKNLVEKLIKCSRDWMELNSKIVSCEISKKINTYSSKDSIKFTCYYEGVFEFEFIYFLDEKYIEYKVGYNINTSLSCFDDVLKNKLKNFQCRNELVNSLMEILKQNSEKQNSEKKE